jgi:peptidoglycan hydrolase-like protein with peptidoglycan-binding domain
LSALRLLFRVLEQKSRRKESAMKPLVLLATAMLAAGCAQTPTSVAPASDPPAIGTAAVQPQPSPAVRDAQQRLRTLGFYAGAIDGLPGPETEAALERYQRNRGFEPTGRLDPATADALRATPATVTGPVIGAAPIASPPVREVQSRLQQFGFYRGPVDGAWGPDTQAALERFQRVRGLDVTGQPTPATLTALGLRPDGSSAQAAGLGEPLDPSVVRSIQQRLRRLGFYSGPIDGIWGAASQQSVERFQRSRGLQPSGDLTPTTLAALGLDPNNLADSAGSGSSIRR